VKVIGAGLPRTATLTQKIALEMLGFGPCYHMVNVLADLTLTDAWSNALAGQAEWDKIFDGFNSAVDYPAAFFHRELLAAYPDAKVVLSVRDGQAWARSMHDTIWGLQYDEGSIARHLMSARRCIDPAMRAYTDLMTTMLNMADLFGQTPSKWDEDVLVAGMERHNAEVRAHVPARQLLEWSPADGWGPLCEFLERPVPAAPLPRVNDTAAFNDRLIAGAMEKLNEWWSKQPAPAEVTAATLATAMPGSAASA
jgi:Sulfotransferase domain